MDKANPKDHTVEKCHIEIQTSTSLCRNSVERVPPLEQVFLQVLVQPSGEGRGWQGGLQPEERF